MTYPLDDLLAAPADDRLTLIELAREAGVAPPTTWRWAMRGVRGLRLPSYMRGHTRMTTRPAYRWWCEQLTARAETAATAPSTVAPRRQAACDRAEAELDAMGI